MFKESAGMMRGFRIVRDPDGILFDTFDYMGMQMGYILTYGEGVPSVHDGKDWVVVVDDETAATYDDKIQEYLIQQGTAVAGAITNPVYAELAQQMGMYAGAAVSTTPADTRAPDETTTTFGE
jgi:hypothetical protein